MEDTWEGRLEALHSHQAFHSNLYIDLTPL